MSDESYEIVYDDVTGDPVYRPIITTESAEAVLEAWGAYGRDGVIDREEAARAARESGEIAYTYTGTYSPFGGS